MSRAHLWFLFTSGPQAELQQTVQPPVFQGFHSKHGLMVHQRSCGSFECFECEAIFYSSKMLKCHMFSDHKTTQCDSALSWYKCICGRYKIQMIKSIVFFIVELCKLLLSLLQQCLSLDAIFWCAYDGTWGVSKIILVKLCNKQNIS